MLKTIPQIRNENDDTEVSLWRDYIDSMMPDQVAETVVSAFSSGQILIECLEYANLKNVPVLIVSEEEQERDYNPHNDLSTYGLN